MKSSADSLRRLFGVLAAAWLLVSALGCQHIVLNTQDRLVRVETRDEKTLSRRHTCLFRLVPPQRPQTIAIALVEEETVSCWERTVSRPWGYTRYPNIMEKSVELLAFPGIMLSGLLWNVLVIFFNVEVKGLDLQAPASPPETYMKEYGSFERRAEVVHAFGGDEPWLERSVYFIGNPFHRNLFRSDMENLTLECLGEDRTGPWKLARKVRHQASVGRLTQVRLGGRDVTAAMSGDRLDLSVCRTALSGKGMVLTVVYSLPDGGTVRGKMVLTRKMLEGLARLNEVEKDLAMGQSDLLAEAAALQARFGDPGHGAALLERLPTDPKTHAAAEAAKEYYAALEERFAGDFRAGNLIRAVAEHHAQILDSRCRSWPAYGEKDLAVLLFRHVGSASASARAQGVVALLKHPDLHNRTALLLGLLGAEPDPLVTWTILWALGRTGKDEAQDGLMSFTAKETNMLLMARANASLAMMGSDASDEE
jgi:hypothetical protein